MPSKPSHYYTHREEILKERKLKRATRLSLLKELKLQAGCKDCGYDSHADALQFDHVRGSKRGNIGQLASSLRSEKALLEELAKCEVRCSNCHSIRTAERRMTLAR